MKVSESITKCDFCGIDKMDTPSPDALHDVFHLTGWPCLLCTSCMDKEFGMTDEEALLGLAHRLLLERLGKGEEE